MCVIAPLSMRQTPSHLFLVTRQMLPGHVPMLPPQLLALPLLGRAPQRGGLSLTFFVACIHLENPLRCELLPCR